MTHRQGTTRAWIAYLAAMSAATLAYELGPGPLHSGPAFNLIAASAVVTLCLGARRHRPRRRSAWHLFAFGQGLFVAGDVLAYNWTRFFGGELPYPSLADVAYLAVYPSLIAGLLLLVRERTPARDRASLIDALLITIGVATVSWVYLMAPYAHDATLSLPTKLISIAYPLMDLFVLGVTVRLAVGAGRRGRAFGLLATGVTALLVTDAVYGWLLLHGGYEPGGWLDAGWAVFYALFGAAALHPSMRTLSEPAPAPDERLTGRRLGLLAGATLLAPGVLGAQVLAGKPVDVGVLTAAAAALFLLVLARMAGLVHHHASALRREAALRSAGEALVMAATRDEIAVAALDAARSLTGRDAEARLYLLDGDGTGVPAAGSDADPAALPVLRLAALSAATRERLAGRCAATLDGAALGAPAAGRAACLAPLFVREELRGLLVALAPRPAGRATQEALTTLAAQVALAVESAALTEDLVRRQAEAQLSALVKHSSDVVCVVAADHSIVYASPSVDGLVGQDAEALVGRSLVDLVQREDARRVATFVDAVAEAGPSARPSVAEFRVVDADGGTRHVEVVATNLLADEAVQGLVLNLRDVSERKAFEAQLSHQAFHDTLTGLPNRALFRNRVEHALERQRRDGVNVAVLFLDLDDFKTVNDSLGHLAGDELLREVGRRLAGCVRTVDTAARLGGDEFAVLIDGAADELHSVEVAERAMAALSAPLELEGHEVVVHASVGITFGDDEARGAQAAEDLLRNADVAMYMAKDQGKGRYQVFQPEMHAAALARLELKADLERAVRAKEFVLHYQPIVDLATGALSGVEALVRWEHPRRGLVSPAEFIPLAEDTGLIVPLGRQILEDACRHAAELQRARPADGPPLTMSVNLSARQLARPQVVEEVRGALEAAGIAPESLVLELTESVMMEDVDLAILRLHELRSLGVRVALDDFGTGYSSLGYLRQLPIDVLKIDRSFVRDADSSGEVRALTETIVTLAGVLQLRPVAEGIEDAAQLARLRELRCDLGQGFYFSRPLPADEILAFVRAGAVARPGATEVSPATV